MAAEAGVSWNTSLQYSKSAVIFPVLWVVLVTNCTLSAVATIINTFILVAIAKTPSLHTPSYILLSSLAASDFVVGFIVQPMCVISKIAELKTLHNIHCSIDIVYMAFARYFSAVSCLTMTLISVDRLFAVLLRLRYRNIVTTRRATIVVLIVWGIPGLLIGLTTTGEGLSKDSAYQASSVLLGLVCIVVTSCAYFASIKIVIQTHALVHSHSAAVELEQQVQQTRNTFDFGRYNRSVMSMLCLYVAFLFCYVPLVLYLLLLLLFEYSLLLHVMGELGRTVMFLNSSLNPSLCYWRIHDLRRAVRVMLSRGSNSNS